MTDQEKMLDKKSRGRPATGQAKNIGVRMDDDLIARVDDWADKHPDKPKRSEAIRQLVERGLKG